MHAKGSHETYMIGTRVAVKKDGNTIEHLPTIIYQVCSLFLGSKRRHHALYCLWDAKIRRLTTYLLKQRRRAEELYLIFLTSKCYSVGARLSGRSTDGLYVLLCRYIRSQATHRYISRSCASYEEPISSYSLELK